MGGVTFLLAGAAFGLIVGLCLRWWIERGPRYPYLRIYRNQYGHPVQAMGSAYWPWSRGVRYHRRYMAECRRRDAEYAAWYHAGMRGPRPQTLT